MGWLSHWRAIVPLWRILSSPLISAGRRVALVELRLLVLDDRLAVDDVLDDAVAVGLDLHGDPLVARIRPGL